MAVTPFRFQAELRDRVEELKGKSTEERRRLVFRWVRAGAIDVQTFGALVDDNALNEQDAHRAA